MLFARFTLLGKLPSIYLGTLLFLLLSFALFASLQANNSVSAAPDTCDQGFADFSFESNGLSPTPCSDFIFIDLQDLPASLDEYDPGLADLLDEYIDRRFVDFESTVDQGYDKFFLVTLYDEVDGEFVRSEGDDTDDNYRVYPMNRDEAGDSYLFFTDDVGLAVGNPSITVRSNAPNVIIASLNNRGENQSLIEPPQLKGNLAQLENLAQVLIDEGDTDPSLRDELIEEGIEENDFELPQGVNYVSVRLFFENLEDYDDRFFGPFTLSYLYSDLTAPQIINLDFISAGKEGYDAVFLAQVPIEGEFPVEVCVIDFTNRNDFNKNGVTIGSEALAEFDSCKTSQAGEQVTFILSDALYHGFGVQEKDCSGLVIGWILCPIIDGLYSAIEFIFNTMFIPLLRLEPLSDTSNENVAAIYDIWNGFRVLANVFFILILFLAILGHAFSWFFTAYELKTIMPRLIIGIILVQISWALVASLIDISNIAGAGVRSLILTPVKDIQTIDLDFGAEGEGIIGYALSGGASSVISGAGATKGLLWLLPMALLPILVAVIGGIVVVIARAVVVMLLAILAPIAYVAWILPGTRSVTQTWWKTLVTALLMYPIIIALVAVGELTSKLLVVGNETQFAAQFAAILALFAPFFLIPQTLKFAGGILATLSGGIDNMRKSLGDRVFGDLRDPNSYRSKAKDYREQYRQQRAFKRTIDNNAYRSYLKDHGRFRGHFKNAYSSGLGAQTARAQKFGRRGLFGGRMIGGLATAAALVTPLHRRMGVFATTRLNPRTIDRRMAERTMNAKQSMQMLTSFGNEDYLYALFGDIHPFTKKPLSAASIAVAKKFRGDQAVLNAASRHLILETNSGMDWQSFMNVFGIANPYALHDKNGEIMLDDDNNTTWRPGLRTQYERYETLKLGMWKGGTFGTQAQHKDGKNREFKHGRHASYVAGLIRQVRVAKGVNLSDLNQMQSLLKSKDVRNRINSVLSSNGLGGYLIHGAGDIQALLDLADVDSAEGKAAKKAIEQLAKGDNQFLTARQGYVDQITDSTTNRSTLGAVNRILEGTTLSANTEEDLLALSIAAEGGDKKAKKAMKYIAKSNFRGLIRDGKLVEFQGEPNDGMNTGQIGAQRGSFALGLDEAQSRAHELIFDSNGKATFEPLKIMLKYAKEMDVVEADKKLSGTKLASRLKEVKQKFEKDLEDAGLGMVDLVDLGKNAASDPRSRQEALKDWAVEVLNQLEKSRHTQLDLLSGLVDTRDTDSEKDDPLSRAGDGYKLFRRGDIDRDTSTRIGMIVGERTSHRDKSTRKGKEAARELEERMTKTLSGMSRERIEEHYNAIPADRKEVLIKKTAKANAQSIVDNPAQFGILGAQSEAVHFAREAKWIDEKDELIAGIEAL